MVCGFAERDLLHPWTDWALCWACGEKDRPCPLEWEEKEEETLVQRIQMQPGDSECWRVPGKPTGDTNKGTLF